MDLNFSAEEGQTESYLAAGRITNEMAKEWLESLVADNKAEENADHALIARVRRR